MSASLVGSEMCIRDRKSAQTRSPNLSKDLFCTIVRAEREYVDRSLPRALQRCVLHLISR
eukprot:1472383-Alexandrium_andersonii.AAC.1